MGRACRTNGDNVNLYRILVRKTNGKRPLGRPRHGWVGNIKMDLRKLRNKELHNLSSAPYWSVVSVIK
jgi:hypothetical protein